MKSKTLHFIKKFNIKTCDVIVAKKKRFGIFKHYIIYKGRHKKNYFFVGNFYKKGFLIIDSYFTDRLLEKYKLVNIIRYDGNKERKEMMKELIKEFDGKPYNLISNNCHHLADLILNK